MISIAVLLPVIFKTKSYLKLVPNLLLLLYYIVILILLSVRVAFAAFVVILIIQACFNFNKVKQLKALALVLILPLIFVITIDNSYLIKRFSNVTNEKNDEVSDLGNRFNLWNCAVDSFQKTENKLFGAGLRNSQTKLENCYAEK
ncbi:MAG: O-antigen ligase family protein, partial [Psychroflexus sp.]